MAAHSEPVAPTSYLSLACINGDAPMIELLLKAGADANSTLPEGETALMTAANTGNVAALNALGPRRERQRHGGLQRADCADVGRESEATRRPRKR